MARWLMQKASSGFRQQKARIFFCSTSIKQTKQKSSGSNMKTKIYTFYMASMLIIATASAADTAAPKENVFETKPQGIKVSIKMIGPYTQDADLQIICLFKHKDSGDTYQGAAKETDAHLNGLLSALRNRGEFVGELGETFLFTPPKDSIPAKRFMVIGLGDEKDLSLESLRVIGRIAAREAVRLEASHVAWAPVIRDEGNSTIEVGLGDRTFVEEFLSAYDTEKRLQSQNLAPEFNIEAVVIEAGPSYFDSAVRQVGAGIESVSAELTRRDDAPYISTSK
jgi:cytosol aminopeptidase family protein